MDRAHATYWLKAHDFINPYWHMREGKPAKITFQEEGMWAKKALSVYLCRYKPVPFSVYVYTCVAT